MRQKRRRDPFCALQWFALVFSFGVILVSAVVMPWAIPLDLAVDVARAPHPESVDVQAERVQRWLRAGALMAPWLVYSLAVAWSIRMRSRPLFYVSSMVLLLLFCTMLAATTLRTHNTSSVLSTGLCVVALVAFLATIFVCRRQMQRKSSDTHSLLR